MFLVTFRIQILYNMILCNMTDEAMASANKEQVVLVLKCVTNTLVMDEHLYGSRNSVAKHISGVEIRAI